MSDTAKQLFEGLKEAMQTVAPGLKDLLPEAKSELARLNTQGRMELASALFSGNAFVAYGPGQYTPTPEQQQEPVKEPEHERGGIER